MRSDSLRNEKEIKIINFLWNMLLDTFCAKHLKLISKIDLEAFYNYFKNNSS